MTFLKTKTKILDPEKLARTEAQAIWKEYKRALNKNLPIVNSHFKSKRCSLSLALEEVASYIATASGDIVVVMAQLDTATNFLLKYMNCYYMLDYQNAQIVDLKVIFRFGVYQLLFAHPRVSSKITETLNITSFNQAKVLFAKTKQIQNEVCALSEVQRYFGSVAGEKPDPKKDFIDKKSR